MRSAPTLERGPVRNSGQASSARNKPLPAQTTSSGIMAQGPAPNSSYCAAPVLPASRSPQKGISIGSRVQGIPQKAFHTLWLGNGYRKLLKSNFLITKPSLKQQSALTQIYPVPSMLDNRRETKQSERTVLFHGRDVTDLEK